MYCAVGSLRVPVRVPGGRGRAMVERWVRFCRSPRWSFRTLIYVALRLAGERGTHRVQLRVPARGRGRRQSPPGRAAREARPRRNPDTLATRTRDGGLVPVRFVFDWSHWTGASLGLRARPAAAILQLHSRHVGGAFVCADAAGPRATSRPCACRARGRCEGRRLWLSAGWLRRIAMRVAGTLSRRSVEGSQLTQ